MCIFFEDVTGNRQMCVVADHFLYESGTVPARGIVTFVRIGFRGIQNIIDLFCRYGKFPAYVIIHVMIIPQLTGNHHIGTTVCHNVGGEHRTVLEKTEA